VTDRSISYSGGWVCCQARLYETNVPYLECPWVVSRVPIVGLQHLELLFGDVVIPVTVIVVVKKG
jgi:hypothetical protein